MNFIENESAGKLRGGYYTDAILAEYLLRWVRGVEPRSLLEPSCGDGAFFKPLSASVLIPSLRRVVGCERDPDEAAKASRAFEARGEARFEIHQGDFLAWVLDRLEEPPDFDAVVGNPPFIRYQYLEEELQERSERLFARLGLPFTRHTNAWVPFVVGSLSRLRPGGRLAMVVPAELLHVLHAASIRRYLLQECSRVLILDPTELWFEGALQGVVLLMAEKRATSGGAGTLGRLAVERIGGRAFLSGDPEAHLAAADFLEGESPTGKWMVAFLNRGERALLSALAGTPQIRPFSKLASVHVGIVTGANDFFHVNDEVVETYDLGRHVAPMFGRSAHVAGVIYDEASHLANQLRGTPTHFLRFDASPLSDLGEGAQRYLRAGQEQGLHLRFKCRVRKPWYQVPSVFSSSVAMLKRSHDFPRLILNSAGALCTDTAYRVEPRGVSASQLVASFLNSLTALCAELEGRHYGGGVLELVPSEIQKLLIPFSESPQHDLLELDALCRVAGPRELLQRQDRALLEGAGLSSSERQTIQDAWWKLRNRRQRARSAEKDA